MARTADIIGDKWSLLILRDVFLGSKTFSQFQKNLGVARNILSDRLDKLVRNEILERRRTRPGVERYSYHFTDRGSELVPVLIAMMQWGDRWIFGEGKEPLELNDQKTGRPIQLIKVLSADGKPLANDEMSASPGSGADSSILTSFHGKRSKVSD